MPESDSATRLARLRSLSSRSCDRPQQGSNGRAVRSRSRAPVFAQPDALRLSETRRCRRPQPPTGPSTSAAPVEARALICRPLRSNRGRRSAKIDERSRPASPAARPVRVPLQVSRIRRGVVRGRTGWIARWRAVDADDAPEYLDAEVVEVDDHAAPPALAYEPPHPDSGMMIYEHAVAELRRTSSPPAPIGRRRRRT
jgi:hypothetical protein